MNLLYALIGVLLGTAVGVLPGIGPALTVALLLPVTFKLDPAGSLIMFAGIYYGGMYGGSTTSILHQHAGRERLDGHRARGQQDGARPAAAGRRSRPRRSAPSSPARSRRSGSRFLAPWLVELALQFGPADYFALMVLAFVTVSATFGDSPLRGLTSLFLGLALGLVGIDLLTGQARLTFGVPELLDGIEVTTLAVGLFAVGETLYVASRRHHDAGEDRAGPGLAVDDAARTGARSWKPWLRGTAARLPDRRAAGRRRRDPDLPLLLDREAAVASIRRSSARARSRASPARRRPTTPRPPARWCRC